MDPQQRWMPGRDAGPFGIVVGQDGAVSDLRRKEFLAQGETCDLCIMDTMFIVILVEPDITITPIAIIHNEAQYPVKLERSDQLQLHYGRGQLVVTYRLDEAFLELLRTPALENDRCLTIIFNGDFVMQRGRSEPVFGGLIEKLYRRTWIRGCLEVWERPVDMDAVVSRLDTPGQLLTIFKMLQMSPFLGYLPSLKAAFQALGPDGLIRYHQRQIELGVQFLRALGEKQVMDLVQAIQTVYSLQTGITAQMYRSLLIYADTSARSEAVKCAALGAVRFLVQNYAIAEALQRNDAHMYEGEVGQILTRYMQAYQAAYNVTQSGSQSILQLLVKYFADENGWPDQLIAAVFYLECPDCQHFSSSVALFYAISGLDTRNPRACYYASILGQTGKLDDEVQRDIISEVSHGSMAHLVLALSVIDKFDDENRRKLIYLAVKQQKHIHCIRQYNPFLRACPLFADSDGGYCPQNLNYRAPWTAFEEQIRTWDIDYVAAFEQLIRYYIQQVQEQLGVEDMAQYDQDAINQVINDMSQNSSNTVPRDDGEPSSVPDDEMCPICFGRCVNMVTLGCTHRLCGQCFSKLTDKCAVCRAGVTRFEYDGEVYQWKGLSGAIEELGQPEDVEEQEELGWIE